MEESAFSSSCEDIELDDSSSSPTGSEDLLDPKFLTPRNNLTHNPPKPQIEEPKDFIYKRPKAYGLLCLPNGNILEYEIPKWDKGDKSSIKRFDSMLLNLTHKDDKNSRASTLKPSGSDFRERTEMFSSNYNGFLTSIKEDHLQEDSPTSMLMNKPIRSLRDVYMGIRKDIKERKQQKETKKQCNDDDSNSSYDSCGSSNEDEDVEMEPSQKKIIEDKVIKLITHWNDMDYIKNNQNLFLSPDRIPPREECKGSATLKEPPKLIVEPNNTNTSFNKESKPIKLKEIRPISKQNKRKKMIDSESKFFKSPLVLQKNNQNNIILFNSSHYDSSKKNSSSEKIFLFMDTKRDGTLRKITFNEKIRKMRMISDSRAYYQLSNNLNNKFLH